MAWPESEPDVAFGAVRCYGERRVGASNELLAGVRLPAEAVDEPERLCRIVDATLTTL
ncbi:hypothetical protein [Streptomyces sp. NBC_00996]|uniref:hypothetical protein n=1 Tax=Streptomyces sp. NBC_00996 TaxID=2903710 RepID=UPI0038676F23|nr:hypothetical protein OG390_47880 [Streptomyces sp. NBC_00996]